MGHACLRCMSGGARRAVYPVGLIVPRSNTRAATSGAGSSDGTEGAVPQHADDDAAVAMPSPGASAKAQESPDLSTSVAQSSVVDFAASSEERGGAEDSVNAARKSSSAGSGNIDSKPSSSSAGKPEGATQAHAKGARATKGTGLPQPAWQGAALLALPVAVLTWLLEKLRSLPVWLAMQQLKKLKALADEDPRDAERHAAYLAELNRQGKHVEAIQHIDAKVGYGCVHAQRRVHACVWVRGVLLHARMLHTCGRYCGIRMHACCLWRT